MEPWRAVGAHNGGLEAQQWSPGGLKTKQGSQIRITLMRSRIWICIKVESRIRISTKVESWIRIRITVISWIRIHITVRDADPQP
jgi:hypothetical protein